MKGNACISSRENLAAIYSNRIIAGKEVQRVNQQGRARLLQDDNQESQNEQGNENLGDKILF